MVWRTYLVMYFGTGNVKVSEIAKRVEKIGFKTVFGSVLPEVHRTAFERRVLLLIFIINKIPLRSSGIFRLLVKNAS